MVSVLCGLALDAVYVTFGISAMAVAGQAQEILPEWVLFCSAFVLLLLSIKPLFLICRGWFGGEKDGCGCSGGSCSTEHDHHH